MSKTLYASYHGAFTEMLLAHFDNYFFEGNYIILESIEVTMSKTEPDHFD